MCCIEYFPEVEYGMLNSGVVWSSQRLCEPAESEIGRASLHIVSHSKLTVRVEFCEITTRNHMQFGASCEVLRHGYRLAFLWFCGWLESSVVVLSGAIVHVCWGSTGRQTLC